MLSENLAEEAIELIAEGFERERDPYDVPWAPKVFGDGRSILVGRTARLRRGWHRKASSARGFTVAPSVTYAAYHQRGTGLYGPRGQKIVPTKAKALKFRAGGIQLYRRSVKGSPARKMLPDRGRIPKRWRLRLIRVAREFFRETLGGSST